MANGTGDTPAYQTERAHRDLDASIEAGRAACQAAILINGGAATALLAYLAGKAEATRGAGGAGTRGLHRLRLLRDRSFSGCVVNVVRGESGGAVWLGWTRNAEPDRTQPN
jgi:hypothetical protein